MCGNEDEKTFKEEGESIVILKILGLINNIELYQYNSYFEYDWGKHKSRI